MKIEVNANSSIRIISDKIICFDPFQIEKESHDADLIFITHDHFDHYSEEDLTKIVKEDTVFVVPPCVAEKMNRNNVVTIRAEETADVCGYRVEAVRSYNVGKQFHTPAKGYLGYIVTIEGKRVYVAGDCDFNEDNRRVDCDIALIPIGGKYTMDYKEAASMINTIRPKLVIPTHYGDVAGEKEDGKRFAQLVDPKIEVRLLLHETI